MLECRKIKKQMDRYLDGDLSPAEREAFLRHLDGCTACRETVHALEELQKGLMQIPSALPPSNLHQSVMEAVRRQADVPASAHAAKKPFYLNYKAYTPVLAAVVLVFLFKFSVYDHYMTAKQPPVSVLPTATAQYDAPNAPVATPAVEENASGTTQTAPSSTSANDSNSNASQTTSGHSAGTSHRPTGGGSSAGQPTDPSASSDPSSSHVDVPPIPSPAPDGQNPQPVAPPTPTDDGTNIQEPAVTPTAPPSAVSNYTVEGDLYNLHVLSVKQSAKKSIPTFRVGEVTKEYYEEIRAALPENGYSEQEYPARENAKGDLYIIHVETAEEEVPDDPASTDDRQMNEEPTDEETLE